MHLFDISIGVFLSSFIYKRGIWGDKYEDPQSEFDRLDQGL